MLHNDVLDDEDMAEGIRLGCQAVPVTDTVRRSPTTRRDFPAVLQGSRKKLWSSPADLSVREVWRLISSRASWLLQQGSFPDDQGNRHVEFSDRASSA